MAQIIGTISGTGRGDGFCIGDGHDETAGLNAFHNAVLAAAAAGENVVMRYEAPPKKYCFSSPLVPLILPSIPTNFGIGHISVEGDCREASILEYTGSGLSALTPLWWFDGNLDADVIDGGFIKDFTVRCAAQPGTDTPPRLPNIVPIRISNRANMHIADIQGIGGMYGVEIDSVLSCDLDRVTGKQNLRNGIWGHHSAGLLSSNNAVNLNSPSTGQNWQGGILWEDGQLNLSGVPDIEGNGRFPSDGKDTGYGIKLLRDSAQAGGGVVACNISGGGYIEGNYGAAAIWIVHSEASNLVFNIDAQSIHRIGGGMACVNDIRVDCQSIGMTALNVDNTGHQDFDGYVPNAINKYLAMNGGGPAGTGNARSLHWNPGYCNQLIELPNNASVGRGVAGINWGYFETPRFWGAP